MKNREWSRRDFLKLGAVAGGAVLLPAGWSARSASAASSLVGTAYPKFATALPRPRRVDMTRGGMLLVDIVQFEQQVLGGFPKTTLWGYQFPRSSATWPGATIVAKKGRRLNVLWRNRLPIGSGPLSESHLLPVDETVHTAMVQRSLPIGNLPTVTHLHGAHVEAGSDGEPEAWSTQSFLQRGPRWEKPIYTYDNDQEAGTLWYHDHTLGITRLNVYAGLAGLYLIRDDNELRLIAAGVLPAEAHEVELAIQDRWFTDDGQLELRTGNNPAPGSIVPSIFPDFMLVNGAPWPYLDVEPRTYRFRLLNGSDSRIMVLKFDNPAARFLRIGTDLGLSDQAVEVERLLVGPAERYDLVVDFSAFAGQSLVLQNVGLDGVLRGFRSVPGAPIGNPPANPSIISNNPQHIPFGFGPSAPANPNSTGLVMQFRVAASASSAPKAQVAAGTRLREGGASLPTLASTRTRKVVLLTGNDQYGRVMELQGTLEKNGGTFAFYDPVTETPALGATEIWEIYNFTVPPLGLVHPIHIHLVHFQILSRQAFTVTGGAAGVARKDFNLHDGGVIPQGGRYLDPDLVTLTGSPRTPEPYEQGWKDTVIAFPGEVTRVIAKFDRPGRYVWHCHLLHHEDHEMMRPLVVGGASPSALGAVAGAPAKIVCDIPGGDTIV